jgi:homoserine dehydrogenase
MNKTLTIGLIGYGIAGQGFHQILQKADSTFARLKTIVVRDRNKMRENPSVPLTYSSADVISDMEIDTVVELINDSNEAWDIVRSAIKAGKNIVTGNKKMVAEHFAELLSLQETHDVSVLYDASVCASIPIIRSIEEYYEKDLLTSVRGILNGSTNYILTKIFDENITYEMALEEARKKGFAESNPYFDVSGMDTLYKLVVLTAHSFRVIANPHEIVRFGIANLKDVDIEFARKHNFNIKLVGNGLKIGESSVAMYVMPSFVEQNNPLYSVNNEYNAVCIDGIGYEKQLMTGKGAGSIPTGSAVFSDVSALRRKYRYHTQGTGNGTVLKKSDNHNIKIYVRSSNPVDFELFPFENVFEKHFKGENCQIIGEISLEKLHTISSTIEQRDVFIAEIP